MNGEKIGQWNAEENRKFLEALRIYGKDWSSIASYIQTR
jgi:hypothetical protein